eukprot:scaffold17461_cov53-Attheya_sp.AAC.4
MDTTDDSSKNQYKYWNREESKKLEFSKLLELSPDRKVKEARIISLSAIDDEANKALHEGVLPNGATLLGIGTSLRDFHALRDQEPNVLFCSPSCPKARMQLPLLLAAFPSIEWVHCRSAGLDFVVSEELSEVIMDQAIMTNAKGSATSHAAKER